MFGFMNKEAQIVKLLTRFLDAVDFYGDAFDNANIYKKAEIALIPILNIAFYSALLHKKDAAAIGAILEALVV